MIVKCKHRFKVCILHLLLNKCHFHLLLLEKLEIYKLHSEFRSLSDRGLNRQIKSRHDWPTAKLKFHQYFLNAQFGGKSPNLMPANNTTYTVY